MTVIRQDIFVTPFATKHIILVVVFLISFHPPEITHILAIAGILMTVTVDGSYLIAMAVVIAVVLAVIVITENSIRGI